jgi:hypothetical protein
MPVEHGQESVDFFLLVDDLDNYSQILRESQNLGGMNTARMAESDMAAQNSCAA